MNKSKVKAVPEQGWRAYVASSPRFMFPEFIDNRHMKVVSLSAYSPAVFTPREIFLVLICVRG